MRSPPGGMWDWQIGLSREFGPIEASLTYIDSSRTVRGARNKNLSDETLVLGVQAGF